MVNKQEFLRELRKGLYGLPKEDTEERVIFYSEMIDDRMEDGLSEQEAVMAVGSAEEIAAQIIAETPFVRIAKERIRPKRKLRTGEIVLLALGSPIWLSLGIAAFAVILSLYITLWTVIISLWSVFASFIGCSICSVLACVIFVVSGNSSLGVVILAAGIVCAGLAIFMFYVCKAATKGILLLTKKIAIRIKNCFKGKEVA